jgi:hypothetical protein
MGTPSQLTQYLDTISKPPSLTPEAGALESDATTGAYESYTVTHSTTSQTGQNVQPTSTGSYTSYVGGYNSDTNNLNTSYIQLIDAIVDTFNNPPTSLDIEKYFNSLTTANPNAKQYVATGAQSTAVTGAFTVGSSLTNLNLTNVTSTTGSGTSTAYAPPTTFSGFVQSMLTFFQQNGYPNETLNESTAGDVTTTPLYSAFLSIFESSTQSSTDWSIIPGYSSTPGTGVVATQFQDAFSAFLNNFPYAQIQNVSSTGTYNLLTSQDFFRGMAQFYSRNEYFTNFHTISSTPRK